MKMGTEPPFSFRMIPLPDVGGFRVTLKLLLTDLPPKEAETAPVRL